MIKDVSNHKSIMVNVYLKSGEEFLGCDIPSSFIHESGLFVSFWHENTLNIFPTAEVKKIICFE